jgi:hypothetical protein
MPMTISSRNPSPCRLTITLEMKTGDQSEHEPRRDESCPLHL